MMVIGSCHLYNSQATDGKDVSIIALGVGSANCGGHNFNRPSSHRFGSDMRLESYLKCVTISADVDRLQNKITHDLCATSG